MVKIIMHGCNGHMGQVITGLVKEDANAEIIAGIDMNDNGQNDYPVFKSLAECDVPADVVVDFSSYKAADALLNACKEKKTSTRPLHHRPHRGSAQKSAGDQQRNPGSPLCKYVPWCEYADETGTGSCKSACRSRL